MLISIRLPVQGQKYKNSFFEVCCQLHFPAKSNRLRVQNETASAAHASHCQRVISQGHFLTIMQVNTTVGGPLCESRRVH